MSATRKLSSVETPKRSARPTAFIGISGWNYAPWRGVFYPPELKHADELHFASRRFSTIELNGSFYSLQSPTSYRRWYQQTPPDFVFSVKGGRFITHMKRLRDVESALANFFASGLLCLREKLGPILWQLPASFAFDTERLQSFFSLLPRTTEQAAQLAARHEPRMNGRAAFDAPEPAPLRHTLEVRHPSFLDPAFVELLRKHQVAACVADTAGRYPVIDAVTSDFVYVRLHGSKQLYTSGYEAEELRAWATRIRAFLRAKRDVYVYFDNDVKVRAPFDAENLERLLSAQKTRRAPRTLSKVTEEPRTTWPAWRKAGA